MNKELEKKEYFKAYYKSNKDKLREKMKAYFEINKDKLREKMKAYREANKDKLREKKKAYYEANKDKIRKKGKAYYKDNKNKINIQFKNTHTYIPLLSSRNGTSCVYTNGVTKEIKELLPKIVNNILKDCIKNPKKYLDEKK